MKLFFKKYGKHGNRPLIILHGLFGISDNWVTYGKRIAEEGFEVFIPDQRNHGRSPHSNVFNYLALTDDLFDFIDDNEIENPIIMGHSMGGKVAMRFALENPDFVKRLIVIDITLKAYGARKSHKKIIEAIKNVDLSKIKTRKDAELLISKYISETKIKLFILKNLHRNKEGKFEWLINIDAIKDNIDQLFDSIDILTKFKKPTLFIKGGVSDYILYEDYAQIRENFPNAEIITVAGASHWVHAEAPELFYQVTSGFMTGKPSWYDEKNEIPNHKLLKREN
jgi:pimeloyl-ACP methyl ester carboxylesterase